MFVNLHCNGSVKYLFCFWKMLSKNPLNTYIPQIRTKQWLVLGALAFQCMRAGFLCPKCENFAGLHTRQDQNELHLKRWFFCFAKIGIFYKSIAGPFLSIVQAYRELYSFGGRLKLIMCQIRYELSVTIYEISTSWWRTLSIAFFLFWFIYKIYLWSLELSQFWNHCRVLSLMKLK